MRGDPVPEPEDEGDLNGLPQRCPQGSTASEVRTLSRLRAKSRARNSRTCTHPGWVARVFGRRGLRWETGSCRGLGTAASGTAPVRGKPCMAGKSPAVRQPVICGPTLNLACGYRQGVERIVHFRRSASAVQTGLRGMFGDRSNHADRAARSVVASGSRAGRSAVACCNVGCSRIPVSRHSATNPSSVPGQ